MKPENQERLNATFGCTLKEAFDILKERKSPREIIYQMANRDDFEEEVKVKRGYPNECEYDQVAHEI